MQIALSFHEFFFYSRLFPNIYLFMFENTLQLMEIIEIYFVEVIFYESRVSAIK